MSEEKLLVLQEILYEDITNKMDECGIDAALTCLVLKGVISKIQDETIARLSLDLLKEKQSKIKNTETVSEAD